MTAKRRGPAEESRGSQRKKRLFEKLRAFERSVGDGWEDVIPSRQYATDLRVYGQIGAESVAFEETANAALIHSLHRRAHENCGKELPNEVLQQSLQAGRNAYRKRLRSSTKGYAASATDPVLKASQSYLASTWYLRPSLYTLVHSLSTAFRKVAAQTFGKLLPPELADADIESREVIKRFSKFPELNERAQSEATKKSPSGMVTRSQQAQQNLYAKNDQNQQKETVVEREKSWMPDQRPRVKTRLFEREEMIMARRRGAHCGLCPKNEEALKKTRASVPTSELIGPFPKKDGSMTLFVHVDCAVWAPEVYTDAKTGFFRHVFEAYNRGRKLTCSACGQKGATIGCYVESCKKTYHYCCLLAGKCRLVEEHFVCFCPKHRSRAESSIFREIISAASAAARARSGFSAPEATFGLDTPHSYFTGLRRGDCEVIFSLAWGVASYPNADSVEETIFSLKRRQALAKGEPLRIRDALRVIKQTVYDIASDKLTSRVQKVYRYSSMEPVPRQRILMVRNYQSCRPFAPGAIQFYDQKAQIAGNARAASVNKEKEQKPSEILQAPVSVEQHQLTNAAVSSSQATETTLADLKEDVDHSGAEVDSPKAAASGAESETCRTREITGWLLFLYEHLEGELARRPHAVDRPLAKRNIAGLWSRQPKPDRERYERRALGMNTEEGGEARQRLFAALNMDSDVTANMAGQVSRSPPVAEPSGPHSTRKRKRDRQSQQSKTFYNIYREIK